MRPLLRGSGRVALLRGELLRASHPVVTPDSFGVDVQLLGDARDVLGAPDSDLRERRDSEHVFMALSTASAQQLHAAVAAREVAKKPVVVSGR